MNHFTRRWLAPGAGILAILISFAAAVWMISGVHGGTANMGAAS